MAVGSLVPLLGMPLYQMFKFVRTPGRMRKVKKARAAGFAAVAVALVAGILLIPTPLRVQGTLVLTAAKPAEIYAEVPGRLDRPERPRRRVRQEGHGPRHPLQPREAARADQQLQEQHDANFAKAIWFGQRSDPESRAQARQHDQMAQQTSSRPSTRSPSRSAS